MEFLTALEPWHWMAIGVAFLAVEVLLSTEVLLGIGLGALATALLYKFFPSLSWQMQILWFGAFSVITTVIHWKKFRATLQESDQPLLNKRTQQLIGTSVALLEPIKNGTGKVQIADALWTVQGPELDAGAQVKVVAVNAMVLVVEAE
mgnify:CR=1 FL=1